MAEIAKDFFVYDLDFLALAFGTTATQNVTIQADSDFVLQKMGAAADVAGAAQDDSTRVIPLATLIITDSGSGRQVMDKAIAMTTIFGDGRLPFILPQPKMFLARSNIAVTLTNYSAATTYNIRLSFIGMKIFRA